MSISGKEAKKFFTTLAQTQQISFSRIFMVIAGISCNREKKKDLHKIRYFFSQNRNILHNANANNI